MSSPSFAYTTAAEITPRQDRVLRQVCFEKEQKFRAELQENPNHLRDLIDRVGVDKAFVATGCRASTLAMYPPPSNPDQLWQQLLDEADSKLQLAGECEQYQWKPQ